MSGYGGKGCGKIIMQNELQQLRNMPRRLKIIRREKRKHFAGDRNRKDRNPQGVFAQSKADSGRY